MRAPHSPKGFSLIELLAVIAILAVLAVVSLPVMGIRENAMNRSLQVTSGMMELARQQAISRNTYVWLLMDSPSPSDGGRVAVVASRDGTDSLSWSEGPVDVSSSPDYELVGRVHSLPHVQVADSATASPPSLPNVTAVAKMAAVNFVVGSGPAARTFSRAVQFTPTGEARVAPGIDRYIDLALLPDPGSATDPNQAVIRISGLTGKGTIYRN